MAYSAALKSKKNKQEVAAKPHHVRQQVTQAHVEAVRKAQKKRDEGNVNDSELELDQADEMELATNFHNDCAASNEISLPLFAKISNNEL